MAVYGLVRRQKNIIWIEANTFLNNRQEWHI